MGGYENFPPLYPTSSHLIFFNGTMMINFLNKQDGIEIWSTCPKPISMSSLLYNKSSILLEFVSHNIKISYVKFKKKTLL